MVRDMFAPGSVSLDDGIVPVQGVINGWRRTTAGCLGTNVVNKLTRAQFLYGPDFSKGGKEPKRLVRLA